MVKKKINRKKNKGLCKVNYFGDGGPKLGNVLLGGIGTAAGNIGGNYLSNDRTSYAGSAISGIGSTVGTAVSAANPLLGGIISGASGLVGGALNNILGSSLNEEKINEIKQANEAMNQLSIDNSTLDSVMNQWGSVNLGNTFSKSDIGSDGIFSHKASRAYNRLKLQQDTARNRATSALMGAASAANTNANLNVLSNFAAKGGYLFEDGGSINIKPSKRGTFTAAAQRHGKGVQEFATHVLANKEDYSPAMVKKANFARNSAKFKHADGGPLKYEDWYKTVPADRNDTTSYNLRRAYELAPYSELEAWRTSSIKDLKEGKNHLRSVYRNPNTGTYEFMKSKNHPTLHFETDWYNSDDPEAVKFRKDYDLDMSGDYYKYVPKKKAFGGDLLTHGTEWDNGVTVIGNGGTHGENPMGGVQMGVDNQGIPNLVEEGEVIFNDYVFSNRLTAPKEALKEIGLPISYKDKSFAYIAKKLSKESEERPNDPISKNGMESNMAKLQNIQEMVRQKRNSKPSNKYGAGSWLRYAPAVGSAIGLGWNLFSKPDYSSADALETAANKAANSYTPVTFDPISNYLSYKPFDRNYYTNKLSAQAGSTRNALMNTLSPSRNAALLAADYAAQGQLGDLFRKAEEFDWTQRKEVGEYNRGTNIANAEMGLKAAMANQQAKQAAENMRFSGIAQAIAMRDAIDARRDANLSANFSGLFESLGNIGIDTYNRNDRDRLIRNGIFGTLSEKPQDWTDQQWDKYRLDILNSLNTGEKEKK